MAGLPVQIMPPTAKTTGSRSHQPRKRGVFWGTPSPENVRTIAESPSSRKHKFTCPAHPNLVPVCLAGHAGRVASDRFIPRYAGRQTTDN
jgi:hypothetical protein